MMEITLQYFYGCPNWETIDRHLAALVAEGLDATIGYESIDSQETAVERGFGGSPTVLINGFDPFADRRTQVGLACRIYATEHGPAGSPTLNQLREAIATTQPGGNSR